MTPTTTDARVERAFETLWQAGAIQFDAAGSLCLTPLVHEVIAHVNAERATL